MTNTVVPGYSGTVPGTRPPSLAARLTAAAGAAATGEGSPPAERLPRHAHDLSREAVTRSQRARILRAVAASIAANGYAATSVADIIKRAGVSRSTFYELYQGKEDAFLGAYAGIELVQARLLETSRAQTEPAAMLRAAVRAQLALLAAEPDFTWMFFVEAVAAGPRILARRRQATESFLDVLTTIVQAARSYDATVPPPDRRRLLAFVGAGRELIATHLLDDEAATLPQLEDALVDVGSALLLSRG
jgi:AcrR family transcriptional regulator